MQISIGFLIVAVVTDENPSINKILSSNKNVPSETSPSMLDDEVLCVLGKVEDEKVMLGGNPQVGLTSDCRSELLNK